MNISEAKEIPIVGYLAGQGIEPESYLNGQAWYLSPLRPGEKNPSFKVNTRINRWKDFGLDSKGGDLIDLVRRLHKVSTTGALLMLESPGISIQYSLSSRGETNVNHTDESAFEVKNIRPLQNRALINYLESRAISYSVAKRYVQECYFHEYAGQVKPYFALYFANDKGGAELRDGYRNAHHPEGRKRTIAPKTITTIQKTSSGLLSLYEGFMDFLSAVEYFKTQPTGTVVVLNSVSNIAAVYPMLEGFTRISLFFDNDPAGNEATRKIQARHSNVTDFRGIIFADHKDFNEFLINK